MPFIFPWLNDLRHRSIQLAKEACSTSRRDTTGSLEPRSPLSASLFPPTASLCSAENEARFPYAHARPALTIQPTSKVRVKSLKTFPPRELWFADDNLHHTPDSDKQSCIQTPQQHLLCFRPIPHVPWAEPVFCGRKVMQQEVIVIGHLLYHYCCRKCFP